MSRADQPAAGAVRIPPHDLDAEQVVLGALLANPGVWDQIADKVGEDDLYLGDHRLIFRAITWLSEHGQAVDPLTVTAWLTQRLPDQAPGLAGLVLELAGAPLGTVLTRLDSVVPNEIRAYTDGMDSRAALDNRFMTSAWGTFTTRAFQFRGHIDTVASLSPTLPLDWEQQGGTLYITYDFTDLVQMGPLMSAVVAALVRHHLRQPARCTQHARVRRRLVRRNRFKSRPTFLPVFARPSANTVI